MTHSGGASAGSAYWTHCGQAIINPLPCRGHRRAGHERGYDDGGKRRVALAHRTDVRLACADLNGVDTGEVRAVRSEVESSLELYHPARQSGSCPPEVGTLNLRARSVELERFQIQVVEQIERIRANLEPGIL
jgi:hypothetical protein